MTGQGFVTLTGTIFNIQRFSIHDGPGIRTTVFFSGCSLRCFWCHNPEGLNLKPQIQFTSGRCTLCGACVAACPAGAQQIDEAAGVRVYQRSRCSACGTCLETCFAGALELAGAELSVAQVLQEILPDRAFYLDSGGGVTLSGGDPLLQRSFTAALLAELRAAGIHTALETAANCSWEVLANLLPLTDLVMMDIKHLDPAQHRAATGVSNERILANAEKLLQQRQPLILRTPVIPGFNDTPAEIAAIARFIATNSAAAPPRWELLPFHQLATDKYQSLGLDYPSARLEPPSPQHMRHLAAVAAAAGTPAWVG